MPGPTLSALPPPPPDRHGWPWTEASPVHAATGAPSISVVVPVFERRAFIEECLRSILLQGYPELELVVIDGGSRDGTVEVLERYAPWLAHWQSTRDRGWRHAVNKGLERAQGRLVTFFGSDDLYLPGAFATVADLGPELGGAGAASGGFFHLDAHSRRLETTPIPARSPAAGPLDLSLAAPASWRLHQVATFYRADALDAVGRRLEEGLVYHADREFLYRVVRAFGVRLVDRPLAGFRLHPGSLTGAEGPRRVEAAREYARMQLGFLCGDGHDRRRRRIARHYLAKAEMNAARFTPGRRAAARALLRALSYEPSRLWSRGWVKSWIRLMGQHAGPRAR